jgi:hypothetical protein
MINNKISKLKNIIQVYTNTETMINNKLAVEWLAKSYVDLFTKLNNEEISLKEFEIQYIELLEQAKEMEKERMIDFANNCIKQIEVSDTCELLMVESPKDLYEQTYGGGEQ